MMMMMMVRSVIILISVVLASVHGYNVGVGRADVTGPAAEIGMMGYAKQGQNTKGRNYIILNFTRTINFQESTPDSIPEPSSSRMMTRVGWCLSPLTAP